MNWKTFGKAILTTVGEFCIITLMCVIGYFFPWISVIIAFVGVLVLVYQSMDKEDTCDDDTMKWFSSNSEEKGKQ